MTSRSAAHPPVDLTSTAHLPLVRADFLPEPVAAGGFFAKLARGWKFLVNSYALIFQAPSMLLPMVIGAVLDLFVFALFLLVFFGTWTLAGSPPLDKPEDWPQLLHWVATIETVLCTFCALYIAYVSRGMVMNMVDAYIKGLNPSIAIAWRDVRKNKRAIFRLTVVSTIVELLIFSLRPSEEEKRTIFGSIRNLILDFIQSVWTVLTFLILPVIMIEDVELMKALSRVREIHSRNLLQITVGEVGLYLVNRIFNSLVFAVWAVWIVLQLAPYFVKDEPLPMTVVAIAIGVAVLLIMAASILTSFAKGAYYTCLYLWAVEVERAGEPAGARVPALLRAALT